MTSKEYMHCVTTVDPHWLAEMGPMFFSVKQPIGNRRLRSEIEREEQRKLDESIKKMENQRQGAKTSKIETVEDMARQISRPASSIVYMGGRMATPKTPHIKPK